MHNRGHSSRDSREEERDAVSLDALNEDGRRKPSKELSAPSRAGPTNRALSALYPKIRPRVGRGEASSTDSDVPIHPPRDPFEKPNGRPSPSDGSD